ELELAKFIYVLDLDDVGLPLFPESVKKELPPYMPEIVEQMVRTMKSNQPQYFHIYIDGEHEIWCPQVIGIGMCNCNGVPRDWNGKDYIQTLTCAVCDESTTGEVGGGFSYEEWLQWGVYKGDCRVREYWHFCGNKYERYICDDCFKTFHG